MFYGNAMKLTLGIATGAILTAGALAATSAQAATTHHRVATVDHTQVQTRTQTITANGVTRCLTAERHRANRHSDFTPWTLTLVAAGACGETVYAF